MADLTNTAAEPLSRREFTLEAALALLSTVVITVEGCGSSSTPAPAPTPTPTPVSDVNGVITMNHGHTATLMAAQITAGNAFALDIRGMATHPHTVEITQADLRALQNRQAVSKDSTNNNNHTHMVTFTP